MVVGSLSLCEGGEEEGEEEEREGEGHEVSTIIVVTIVVVKRALSLFFLCLLSTWLTRTKPLLLNCCSNHHC